MSQLKTYYEKEVAPRLAETFQYKNRMQVPKLVKIVLNMGLGEAIQNIKVMDSAVEELKAISGQKPVITRAKKIYRRLQVEGRNADRVHGDPSSRKNVRLLLQAGERCSSACSGLQGGFRESAGWSGKLHPRG